MGMIGDLLRVLFGGGGNVVRDTVEVFRPNAEAEAARTAGISNATLAQFAAEFGGQQKNGFDRFMDGVNRLPRPALALGTLCLFVTAMVDPIWFAERMQGVALVPEPLWWLLGVIVSFYFGARHQLKAQNFQKQIATTVTMVPRVVENIRTLDALRHDSPGVADTGTDAGLAVASTEPSDNPAVEAWRVNRSGAAS